MVAIEVEATRAQIQRMCISKTFETSEAQRRLLLYLAEKALSGEADRLKEYTVGLEAFGKPSDYDPQQDSIVRTQTGRLRAKLLEYYGMEGKDDPVVVELPKGGFKMIFRPRSAVELIAGPAIADASPEAWDHPAGQRRPTEWIAWTLAACLAIACAALGYWAYTLREKTLSVQEKPQVPWPLSRVMNERQHTVIVGTDPSLTMLRFFNNRPRSLEEYLSKDFPNAFLPQAANARESKLLDLLFRSPLTGHATLQNIRTIVALSGPLAPRIAVRLPREFRPRDLRDGNAILIGSSISNPWVSLFEQHMNFREVDEVLERGEKYFLNRNPQQGELPRYQGIPWGGTSGVAYASIVLVPNEQRSSNVLILQGLQAEGTEAAGLFLSLDDSRRKLRDALLKLGADPEKTWFEVLIRAKAIATAPGQIEIVAVRLIQ